MARVFISHASVNVALAYELHRWMTQDGHQVFLDQHPRDGIAVGDEWERRLHERLRWADAVVCVVTSAYLASVWCTAELATAQSRGSRLLPVLAEPGVTHPLLSTLQQTDPTMAGAATRDRLREALLRIDAAGGGGWPDNRSPFPGLRPIDTDMRRAFFGRACDVEKVATLLRSPGVRAENAALMIVGPSGSGKSSFVRAGLLPALAAEPGWLTVPAVVPGTQPTAALARELADVARRQGIDWSVGEVHRCLGSKGLVAVADELLLTGPGPRRTRLLLVVDQFEELLNHASRAERIRFVTSLGAALAGPVAVVCTIRPEFLDQFLTDRDLAGLPTRLHTFRPMPREALRAVIEGPARLAGITIDEGLASQLVADADTGESLPLLAYTLAQLADGVGRGGRLLTSRYWQLGGVGGTLARQADAALDEAMTASRHSRTQVVKNLMRLVTVDEDGRPTRWRLRRADVPGTVAAEFNAFIARRLLTTDLDEHGQVVIGVAHEAFLSAWPPLAEAITAASAALRTRRQLDQAAANWNEHGQTPKRLWERGQLAAALADTGARLQRCRHTSSTEAVGTAGPTGTHALRRQRPVPHRPVLGKRVVIADRVELSHSTLDFLRASIYRDRLRRGRSTTILSTLLVLALLAAGVARVQQRAATDGQRLATSHQLVTQADAAMHAGDPRLALQLDEAADRIHPDPETRAGLVSAVLSTPYSRMLTGHTDEVLATAYSPDGHTLATSSKDQTVQLWDTSEPTQPRRIGSPLTGYDAAVVAVAFSSDGHTLATASANAVVLWQIGDRLHPHRLGDRLTGHTDAVSSIAFAPNQQILATASADQTVMLWDLSDPAHPHRLGDPLTGHTDAVTAIAFAPDGHILATASSDQTAMLWDVSDPAHPRRLGDPINDTSYANAIAFSPNGRTIAVAGGDETVLLTDVSDPAHPRPLGDPLHGHTGAVFAVAFSPDGRTLATAGNDRAVLLWDVSDPTRPSLFGDRLTGHTAAVNALAFAPDGRTLASAGSDRIVLVWDLAALGWPGRSGSPLTGHNDAVRTLALTSDARTLATASDDKTVILWDVSDPAHPHRLGLPLTGHTAAVKAVTFSPNGHILATAGNDNTVILWDTTDPAHPHRLGDPLTDHTDAVEAVAFTSDGRTLATAGNDNTVILWDTTDPAHPHRLGDPLTDHTDGVMAIAFTPDGHTLATASADNTVILWDTTDPADPRRLAEPLTDHTDTVYTVAFTPDGHTLATAGNDNTVILWDTTDPAHPHRLGDPLLGHTNGVMAVAFTPDGHTLATADADDNMIFWDVSDPTDPHRLTARTADVNALVFTPDGNTLITAGSDSTVQLWGVTSLYDVQAHPMEHACSLTQHGLDPNQWNLYAPGVEYEDTCPAATNLT